MLQSAFKTAMLDQVDSAYGLAYAMTRCPKRAEELSFLSFGNALRQIKAANCIAFSPRVLLFRSLYQTLCGATSERKAVFPSELDPIQLPDIENANDSGELDWHSLSDELKAALDSLPIELRFVLYLWGVEAISSHEIAEVLELPSATVCGRLKQAREMLYRSLTLNRQRTVYADRRLSTMSRASSSRIY